MFPEEESDDIQIEKGKNKIEQDAAKYNGKIVESFDEGDRGGFWLVCKIQFPSSKEASQFYFETGYQDVTEMYQEDL